MELVRIVHFDRECLVLCKKLFIVFSSGLVPSDNRCKHVILLEDLKKAKIPYIHTLFVLACFPQSSFMTVWSTNTALYWILLWNRGFYLKHVEDMFIHKTCCIFSSLYMWEISLYFNFKTQIFKVLSCFSFTWNESDFFIYELLHLHAYVYVYKQVTAAALCCKIKNTNKKVKEFPWLLQIKPTLFFLMFTCGNPILLLSYLPLKIMHFIKSDFTIFNF